MPRTKKKKRIKPLKNVLTEPDPIMPEQESINNITTKSQADQKDDRMTKAEAIEWFKKNPHEEHFVSLDKPGTAVAAGSIYVQFKDGELRTSDPAVVEALLMADAVGAKYGTHFVALNQKLRNLK